MKNYCSNQARLVGYRLLFALGCVSAPATQSAGRMDGWVIDNGGNMVFTPAQCAGYTANGVRRALLGLLLMHIILLGVMLACAALAKTESLDSANGYHVIATRNALAE